MIVDASFFYGPLSIEGIMVNSGADFTQAAIRERVNQYIELFERQYLVKLLGMELAGEFIAYTSREEDKEAVAKWDNLLARLVPMPRVSPIANYVYFHYVRGNQVHATSLGATETNSDNKVVSCDPLIIPAWNGMVDMNRAIHFYLEAHEGEYEGFATSYELLEKINILGI